ncbi:hypothetical protein HanXRQr2_Chr03g0116581 [Helianthus annuus]|uniref:Uncharacterized protein n=1 Tax=Helianthus annuus TaxID=4232 RepID=A0A9K3JGB0_HELAN|nr:hypothetical protein HanXRQr2_Chr03g0116581 [Helianthus annuus]KAJ0593475.1 hypothetical protein HanHA300_Chr03g0097381 [Helianthus annuus]KAJ0601366.1 hypothetical protein HanIR_Chr03g0127471 [Helianthus annuus]KAJ0608486.1 hypothetical protein HanHA89_Chr03g0109071 [Helianthus annuus]KAJ0768549.1 hypothetical protein HanLR1_Chr03g0102431 [Helianthus annuus]
MNRKTRYIAEPYPDPEIGYSNTPGIENPNPCTQGIDFLANTGPEPSMANTRKVKTRSYPYPGIKKTRYVHLYFYQ